jgi:hypothetical protein
MDVFRTRGQRRDAGFWTHFGHLRRDEAREQEDEDEREQQREPTGTVCEDDEIVYRGANPRTGIVSPFTFCDGNGNECQELDMLRSTTGSRGTSDENRKERGFGWGLVENPRPQSPRKLDDTKMSGRLHSRSQQSDEETQEYRYELGDLFRSETDKTPDIFLPILSVGRKQAFVRSTPLATEIRHIPRKEVGSGDVTADGFKNPEKNKLLGPQEISTNDNQECKQSMISSNDLGITCLPTPSDQVMHLDGRLQNHESIRDIMRASPSNRDSQALEKYIPGRRLLQLTQVSSLPTSLHPPAPFLAMQQRAIGIRGKRWNTPAPPNDGTWGQTLRAGKRPQVNRKFGTTLIPTMHFHESDLEDERQNLHSIVPQGNVRTTHHSMRTSMGEPTVHTQPTYEEYAIRSLGKTKLEAKREIQVRKVKLNRPGIEIDRAISAPVANA